ncbi:quinol:cytochrome C oxidoreductase [Flaviaesturariibacter aridisoli]|nr:quinol:cytochrome C oxidoreductase [Flaviaesturariibacter aridisoli]
MAALREQFVVTKRYNTLAMALMGIGILSLIILFVTHGMTSGNDEHAVHERARFWGSLLQNSVYFLLVVNAVMFFICATTLAWGGFQMSFRRVTEAISTCVPVLGVITLLVLLAITYGGDHALYHWTDKEHVQHDEILKGKSGFLNSTFFTVWTIITIAGWWFLGRRMRHLSRSIDDRPLNPEEAKAYQWTNTVRAAHFIVLFALTVLSSTPWLWLMSINAHWYSTMFSWYTFASSFVAGLALITLFVVYLKNSGYLELVTKEHLHDLGKFMFAFSIFWTYLWYSQFMLIWYANIPEETVYFKPRIHGVYRGVFFLNLIINFLAPLLILMKRGSKRNYGTISLMAVLILFGHWLDFYQMVFPGISEDHVPFMLADFGIALGFVGLIMFVTAKSLARHPLYARNHPFLKESIVHHT